MASSQAHALVLFSLTAAANAEQQDQRAEVPHLLYPACGVDPQRVGAKARQSEWCAMPKQTNGN
jgi:hypothetical protein